MIGNNRNLLKHLSPELLSHWIVESKAQNRHTEALEDVGGSALTQVELSNATIPNLI